MNHDRNVISLEARRREKERAAEVYRKVYFADRAGPVRSHSKAGISTPEKGAHRFDWWMDRISVVAIAVAVIWWFFGNG